ncbi:MAG: TonB-dependent receptor plug domain-containing protein, partial [Desulfobacula sp.]|uniref:TonB-dependent receptor plug domain-containing protein n=1 Tax=Desulfobacula sp. TaxID=2593537 RepID=UPI0025B7CCD4
MMTDKVSRITKYSMMTDQKIFNFHYLNYIVMFSLFVMINLSALIFPGICHGLSDTDLMFVGEELKVITIASGREEGAWKAPAVADVITRDEIKQKGISTLAELLNFEPGFLISESEAGYNIYLRGISDSVLFLNEAVPTGSKLNKNYNRINPYLSLESVKRIEIIRGPGSVLWGADAFAGIVNIVPLTGKDFQGVRTGMRAGNSVRGNEAYLHWGRENDDWNSFLSISGGNGRKDSRDNYNFTNFWGDEDMVLPVPSESRYGDGSLKNPTFFEASGNADFGELFRVSTNLSFYSKPYTRSDEPNDNLVWKEENEAFSGFIKMEGSKKYNITSGVRWTTYFSWFDTQTQIVDLTLENHDRVVFGEIVHEKSILNGDGLFTTGASIRQEKVEDLPVWDSYYPDFFTDDNVSFVPWPQLYDYSITTLSLFGQYQQSIGSVDIWAGIRGDDHEHSEGNVSYNTGISWSP